jgi:hypothetical protein
MKFRTLLFFSFCCFFAGSTIGCKKSPPAITYSNMTIQIALVDYTFGRFAAGAWTTGTKIKIRCAGTSVDSLNSLIGCFNVGQGVSVMNGCGAHFQTISHTFKIQDGSINSMEFIDQGSTKLFCDLTATAVYFNSVYDSTTALISNSGCPLSVFAAR